MFLLSSDFGNSVSLLEHFQFWLNVPLADLSPVIILGDFITHIDDSPTTLASHYFEVFLLHDFNLDITPEAIFHS
jgi:hypothetical protein